MEPVNLAAEAARTTVGALPRAVARVDNREFMLMKARAGSTVPPHRHHGLDELFLVVEGRLTIAVGGRAVTVGSGELFVVPNGLEHSTRADEETTFLVMDLLES